MPASFTIQDNRIVWDTRHTN